jgi:hypothetical protein
VNLWNAVC